MNLTPFPIQTLSLNNNNQSMMSRSLFRTVIRPMTSVSARRISTEPYFVEVSLTESNLVEKIEDAIHRIIVKRSEPDWLPFRPGSSYWVPPRRPSYGFAEMLSNPLSQDPAMASTYLQGWPSSDFFLNNDNIVEVSSSDAVQVSSSDAGEESSSSDTKEDNNKTSSTVVKEET